MMMDKKVFRYRFGEQWLPVLCALACIVAIWVGLAHPSRRIGGKWRDLAFSLVVAIGALSCVRLAWIRLTTSVALDDEGIRSTEGTTAFFLSWDQIEGLHLRPGVKAVEWSLVEKGTGLRHALPFMPRELFLSLKERVKSVPPDVQEHHLR